MFVMITIWLIMDRILFCLFCSILYLFQLPSFSLLQLPHVHLNRPPKSFYIPMLLIIDIFKILGLYNFISLFRSRNCCYECHLQQHNEKKNQKSENKTPIMVNSKEKTSKCLPRELEVMLNMELPNYRSVYCTKDRCLQIWECLCYCAWQLSLAGPQW